MEWTLEDGTLYWNGEAYAFEHETANDYLVNGSVEISADGETVHFMHEYGISSVETTEKIARFMTAVIRVSHLIQQGAFKPLKK